MESNLRSSEYLSRRLRCVGKQAASQPLRSAFDLDIWWPLTTKHDELFIYDDIAQRILPPVQHTFFFPSFSEEFHLYGGIQLPSKVHFFSHDTETSIRELHKYNVNKTKHNQNNHMRYDWFPHGQKVLTTEEQLGNTSGRLHNQPRKARKAVTSNANCDSKPRMALCLLNVAGGPRGTQRASQQRLAALHRIADRERIQG
ncbi:hypothetical protein LUU34_00469200 [Aix galericulata]|nr:hypothetical protein LUU34_00469200 [Aix galericulata]